MSWILTPTGGSAVTLPNPQGFSRKFLEKSVMNETVNGTSRKDTTNRKEQFVLRFNRISQATVAQILAIYEAKVTAVFSVTDGSLSISSTECHVDCSGRNYNTKGSEFREDFDLVLTEVS